MARIARIGTTCMNYYQENTHTGDRALVLVEAAGASRCDLVLLPETFLRDEQGKETVDRGEVEHMVAQLQALAAKHPCTDENPSWTVSRLPDGTLWRP